MTFTPRPHFPSKNFKILLFFFFLWNCGSELLSFAGLIITASWRFEGPLQVSAKVIADFPGTVLHTNEFRRLYATPTPSRTIRPLQQLPLIMRHVRCIRSHFRVLVLIADILHFVEHHLNYNYKLNCLFSSVETQPTCVSIYRVRIMLVLSPTLSLTGPLVYSSNFSPKTKRTQSILSCQN